MSAGRACRRRERAEQTPRRDLINRPPSCEMAGRSDHQFYPPAERQSSGKHPTLDRHSRAAPTARRHLGPARLARSPACPLTCLPVHLLARSPACNRNPPHPAVPTCTHLHIPLPFGWQPAPVSSCYVCSNRHPPCQSRESFPHDAVRRRPKNRPTSLPRRHPDLAASQQVDSEHCLPSKNRQPTPTALVTSTAARCHSTFTVALDPLPLHHPSFPQVITLTLVR